MILTLPDCCVGDFCPGIDAQEHNKREDGTYYSTDDHKTNAFHYHNTDGSVFYRYPDGSEYYRRKNGRVEFRLLQDPPEKVEGAGPAATPPKAEERTLSCWYPWPPPLNLSVRTDGPSLTIRDASGSTITFEPVGPGVNAEQTLVGDGSPSAGHTHSKPCSFQASKDSAFGVQDWVRKQAMLDIASRETGHDTRDIFST